MKSKIMHLVSAVAILLIVVAGALGIAIVLDLVESSAAIASFGNIAAISGIAGAVTLGIIFAMKIGRSE